LSAGAERVGAPGDALKDDVFGGSVGGMEMHFQVREVLPVLSLLVPEVSDSSVSRTRESTSFALAAHWEGSTGVAGRGKDPPVDGGHGPGNSSRINYSKVSGATSRSHEPT